ncbi:hypothetical protein SPI_04740 [Niveomyces insectorum RCEF 264]|uniref:Uncharacterized protein n=1 Tax=Niveomyces insectorum RCEF 264 TaxID=1081102 RepID=A0A167UT32_9HYPO|nr:hypothetical protein SPI_04740 [Niveomyces insectorum RCEF 264]
MTLSNADNPPGGVAASPAPLPGGDGPVVCTCGKVFKTGSARQEHQKHAQVHKNDEKDENTTLHTDTGGETTTKNKNKNKNKNKKKGKAGSTVGSTAPAAHLPPPSLFTSLRMTAVFRAYDDLPQDGTASFLWPWLDEPPVNENRHWCYLGEVDAINDFLRIMAEVRDVHGDTVRLAFHTDDRGFPAVRSKRLRPGHSVLVMYAEQHSFLDGTIGMRLENAAFLKACQTTGWKDKNHKRECPVVRDKELQNLLQMDWNTRKKLVRFMN